MHIPVLLGEVISLSRECNPQWILDGTFGRGGHTRGLLEACPEAHVVAVDQDEDAIKYANQNQEFQEHLKSQRLQIQHLSFHELNQLANRPPKGFDVILLDLGVSSPQLDQAERGFSFYHDGPLDMRMNRHQQTTAADIINTWSEVELHNLFREYGEIHRPQRVVQAIVQDRKTKPFATTRDLASLIERIQGWRKKGHHPATEFFLALRMVVNQELTGLEACLPILMGALSQTGRLIVITFHSLEDRIIKYAFREATQWGKPLFKKVIIPSREELLRNPRARSAKLRVFQRGGESDVEETE